MFVRVIRVDSIFPSLDDVRGIPIYYLLATIFYEYRHHGERDADSTESRRGDCSRQVQDHPDVIVPNRHLDVSIYMYRCLDVVQYYA